MGMALSFDCRGMDLIPGWGSKGLPPGGSDGKESACKAGDLCSILGSERPPGEGGGSPPQCSCLENPMDRGAWRAPVPGAAKNQTRLSN